MSVYNVLIRRSLIMAFASGHSMEHEAQALVVYVHFQGLHGGFTSVWLRRLRVYEQLATPRRLLLPACLRVLSLHDAKSSTEKI